MKRKVKEIHRFSVLGILFISLLLGETLAGVSTIPLYFKSFITVLNLNKIMVQRIVKNDQSPSSLKEDRIYTTNLIGKRIESIQNLSFLLLLPLILVIFFYHAPLYSYFRLKKRNPTSPKLERRREKSKRRLLNSANFLAVSVFFWNLFSYIPYLLSGQQNPPLEDVYLNQLSVNFIIIKIISALLTILFIYLWQNHRVKTHFVPAVFNEEELRSRQCCARPLNIKRQLIISTLLTTFLPLVLILFYSYTFVSFFPAKKTLTSEQSSILLGNYTEFFHNNDLNVKSIISQADFLPYYNSVDTVLLFLSIIVGVSVALFYLFCITRWTIAEVVIPIQELREVSRKVSQGEFNHYAVVRNDDEIGELSEGFNLMIGHIRENISEITVLNLELTALNQELEKKVDARTQELQKLNDDLQSEVEERTRAEEALRNTNEKLRIRNETMEGELEMARKIQLKLIPSSSPHPSISFYYKPMDKVGGDFYDFIPFHSQKEKQRMENIGIFISDVSGHGVPAAFITSMIKGVVAQGGDLLYEPSELLLYLNDFLITQTNGNFVTAFYGIYNIMTRTIVYSNAGHNLPYIIGERGVTQLDSRNTGIPLAIMSSQEIRLMKKAYVNEMAVLDKKTKLLLYTDGLIEAVNIRDKIENENTLDFENACMNDAFMEHRAEASESFVKKMSDRLIEFRGSESFEDDVCMICIDVD